MAEEKSHKPTQKKLDKARKDGKVLKSQLFSQSLVALVAISACILAVRISWVKYTLLLQCFSQSGFEDLSAVSSQAMSLVITIALATLLPAAAVALLLDNLQQGFKVETGVLALKGDRLDPAAGFKRIFGGLAELWQHFIRVVVLMAVFYGVFGAAKGDVLRVFLVSSQERLGLLQAAVGTLVGYGCLGMVFLGGIDYLVKRRKFFKELSMSLDDLRREHKESEGDPHIKSHRRQLHEEMCFQDQVQRVRQAKALVVKRAE